MCARARKARPHACTAVPAILGVYIRFGRFFKGKKVAKGVCNVAKLATMCISISPTTSWATVQTENTRCINHALIKFVPLKGICVNFDSTNIYIYIYIYMHTLTGHFIGYTCSIAW